MSLLVWLLCLLLGPAPALPALHFALVQHRICPEHGELLHVADAEVPGAAAPAARDGKDTETRVEVGTPGASDAHGHEVCGVSGVGGNVALLPAAGAGPLLLERRAAALRPGAEHAHVGIALLRYAPKLAPPAAALPAPLAAFARA